MKMIRSYSELREFKTFLERYNYLRLDGKVGTSTFGFDRYLNQVFYRSREWLRVRDDVIIRDGGCDLGIPGYEISYRLMIHHMNPISVDDVKRESPDIINPEYLVCVSHQTHEAIHYGDRSILPQIPIIRYPNDTSPWRKRRKHV